MAMSSIPKSQSVAVRLHPRVLNRRMIISTVLLLPRHMHGPGPKVDVLDGLSQPARLLSYTGAGSG